ncbi:hypothetical protein HYT60_01380 [Candidatus Woesebacteria bacterium]|nr:hypothetical protein [Candidatus Woesebacteria bacterium]
MAIYDPLAVPNNSFGIHMTQEADLEAAAALVNSPDGRWGYVTFVIQKGERNAHRWQKTFNQLRKLHLIPLVRIATAQLNNGWEKPSLDEIDGWVDFLGSLNWPVANRYVIVGNEPNHKKEWGGEISPEGYGEYLKIFSQKLKGKSDDFFVLPAALDVSARNTKDTLDATLFWQRMLKAHPDIFDWVDGLNSHSYPNPNFSGSEKATGRGTTASFLWEDAYLRSLGLTKNFPIFITETGWAHNMGLGSKGYLNPEELGAKLEYAFNNNWNNPRVVAVTPFILNYQNSPFDIFSWQKPDGNFYPFYETVKALPKTNGEPIQRRSGEILGAFLPAFAEPGETFSIALIAKNTGQSIWNEETELGLKDLENGIVITKTLNFPKMEPGETKIILFEAILNTEAERQLGYLTLFEGRTIVSNAYPFEIRIYRPQSFSQSLISFWQKLACKKLKIRLNSCII